VGKEWDIYGTGIYPLVEKGVEVEMETERPVWIKIETIRG